MNFHLSCSVNCIKFRVIEFCKQIGNSFIHRSGKLKLSYDVKGVKVI